MRITLVWSCVLLLVPSASALARVKGEEVTYRAGDTKMKGFVAFDTARKGKRPGVLVVHEWWGHNDYARRRAKMLAAMGYVALAVDMYGDGKRADHPADAKKFAMQVMGNLDQARGRFVAALQLLQAHERTDPKKIAAIGYCFGGGVVLQMARLGLPLLGVASFHGSLATKTPAKKGAVKARILVLNGGADPMVSAEQIAAFDKEMKAAGADFRVINYPGAKHAFTNPAADALGKKFKLPIAYDKRADRKSWRELRRFLARLF